MSWEGCYPVTLGGRDIMTNFSQGSLCPSQDLNLGHAERGAEVLPTQLLQLNKSVSKVTICHRNKCSKLEDECCCPKQWKQCT
jgi:hypothetical protein